MYLLGMLTVIAHLFTLMLRSGADLDSLRMSMTWMSNEDVEPHHISVMLTVLITLWPLYWMIVAANEPPTRH